MMKLLTFIMASLMVAFVGATSCRGSVENCTAQAMHFHRRGINAMMGTIDGTRRDPWPGGEVSCRSTESREESHNRSETMLRNDLLMTCQDQILLRRLQHEGCIQGALRGRDPNMDPCPRWPCFCVNGTRIVIRGAQVRPKLANILLLSQPSRSMESYSSAQHTCHPPLGFSRRPVYGWVCTRALRRQPYEASDRLPVGCPAADDSTRAWPRHGIRPRASTKRP